MQYNIYYMTYMVLGEGAESLPVYMIYMFLGGGAKPMTVCMILYIIYTVITGKAELLSV